MTLGLNHRINLFEIDTEQAPSTALADVHPTIDLDLLRQLADGVRSDSVGSEDATRALWQVFEDTFTFEGLHGQLNAELKTKVSAFLSGVPAETITAQGFDPTRAPLNLHRHPSSGRALDAHKKHRLFGGRAYARVEQTIDEMEHRPVVFEDYEQTKIMEVYAGIPFLNWQQNIHTRPALTFVPSTVLGLQNLIKAYPHKRIRCSGYHHTRSEFFVEDGDILVSFVSLHHVASVFPEMINIFTSRTSEAEVSGELRSIQTFPPRAGQADTQRAIENDWSLPVDVTADEITTGRIIGSMCHGSGFTHKPLNDYVRSLEYVDVNGAVQTITDPLELHGALGCFGLIGIITHVTYEVKKMTYAVMQPRKVKTMLAIPPPDTSQVPEALHVATSPEELQEAIVEFERRAEQDYYAEWSWFSYQSDVLVNTWSTVSDSEGQKDYTTPTQTFLQWIAAWITAVIIGTDFYADIPARWQSQLLATGNMAVLSPLTTDPDDLGIKTKLPNALHFRRGRHYARSRNMELELPIPPSPTDQTKPDCTTVRKAWWSVIDLVYRSANSPMRLAMDMRITSDSEIIMAPQRGNNHGIVVIEIGSVTDTVTEEEWQTFCQDLVDALTNLAPVGRLRPHWGKEWAKMRFGGLPARDYIRTVAYKSEIPECLTVLEKIGKRQGWTLKDLRKRFSNRLLDDMFFSDTQAHA
ncbi:hypothetical protein QM012_004671 [Aureobasidium pullulans]|uniref:FAD-binding PCMH-type domain-containing protein n=1 Tax=Aureobasidium pullulans TaxID=5580 RepID=A0ABR0TU65_AURPU